jgi:MFS family permease
VALGLALRLLALGRFSLGNDEIAEVRWSALPWRTLIQRVAADGAHPPLDYLVQGALGRLGASEPIRRLPSVAAGAATVALAVVLARSWFGTAAGIGAGLLLAASPVHIRFSQEIRPYGLGLFFLLASVAALESFRRRPTRWARAAWLASVLAAAYTLYFAGLVAGLVTITSIFIYRRGTLAPLWRTLPATVGVWALLYAPWLPVVVKVARHPPPLAREPLNWEWVRHRLQVLGTGDWQIEPMSWGSFGFWLLVLIGVGAALWQLPARIATVWFILGGALQVIVLQLRPQFPAVRHLLPAWLGSIFLAGAGLWALGRGRVLPRLRWLAVFFVLLFDARTLFQYYDHGRPEWDRVAAYLRASLRPGERVIAANRWVSRNLGYYWDLQQLDAEWGPLERAGRVLEGPIWIVTAVCPMTADVARQMDRLPLRRAFPTTNHCEVRFLPAGARLIVPNGFCVQDF